MDRKGLIDYEPMDGLSEAGDQVFDQSLNVDHSEDVMLPREPISFIELNQSQDNSHA